MVPAAIQAAKNIITKELRYKLSNRIKRISNTRMNIDADSSINLFKNEKDVVLPHPKKSANPCKAPSARAKGKSTASK